MVKEEGERVPLGRVRCRVLLLLCPVLGVSICRFLFLKDWDYTIVVSNATLVAILKDCIDVTVENLNGRQRLLLSKETPCR